MKAIRRAETAPIARLPTKINKNCPTEESMSCEMVASVWPVISTVWYMTMPIASLKMDSPKMIEYRLMSASISLNTANTLTGSVAEIKLPNAKASLKVKYGEREVCPTK